MFIRSGVGISWMVALALIFVSCDQSTTPDLQESFANIRAVTPIAEAQNETMNLQRSSDDNEGYFTVTLSDGSIHEAWCLEWNEPSIRGEQSGVKLHSTKGHPEWKKLNYFMQMKDRYRAADPSLTNREIQVVIWSLVNNPPFYVDHISQYKDIDPDFYRNGKHFFDVKKVKQIVASVHDRFNGKDKGNALQSESNNDEYPGITLIENDGQTIVVGNETAFAVKTMVQNGSTQTDASISACFDEEIITGVSFPRWGWTNVISEGEYTFDIYAGAGQCDLSNGTLVGELEVDYENGTLTATYTMTQNSSISGQLYTLNETHFYAGSAPYPTQQNNKYTVAPGQYGNVNYHNHATQYTYEVDGLSGDIYFIAHAVVSGFNQPD